MKIPEPVFVQGGLGIRIATYEYGNPDGPAILLIHGFNQCHLCWEKQFSGPLAAKYRIVALDLRGHGNSEKPDDPAAYRDQGLWGDDIHAVISGLGLADPVLVGWSYGGHIINGYVEKYGTGALAGLVYVGAITVAGNDKAAPMYLPESRDVMSRLADEDAYAAMQSVTGFVERCFAVQPDAKTLQTILAYNMLVPVAVRRAMRTRVIDADAVLAAIDIPTLIIHGEEDRIVLPASGRHIAEKVPESRLLIYDNTGHCPFFEAADRFNADLGGFVGSIVR